MSQNGGAYSTIATATFSSGVTATFQGTFTAPTDTASTYSYRAVFAGKTFNPHSWTASTSSALAPGLKAAAASSLIVSSFPSPSTADVAGSVTVTAKDAYGNTAKE